jgi:hypothetical protein
MGRLIPAILSLPGRKRKDTAEIYRGSCPGVKVPPCGGRFSPGHPSLEFFGVRLLISKTGNCRLQWEKRKKSVKLRIICRIFVVTEPFF